MRVSVGEIEVYDAQVGPRDLDKFSKWPMIFRLQGSILPAMAVPLLLVAAWATAIRCISVFVHPSKLSSCKNDILKSNRCNQFSRHQPGSSYGSRLCCRFGFELSLQYGI
jgi:hypothetical protein